MFVTEVGPYGEGSSPRLPQKVRPAIWGTASSLRRIDTATAKAFDLLVVSSDGSAFKDLPGVNIRTHR